MNRSVPWRALRRARTGMNRRVNHPIHERLGELAHEMAELLSQSSPIGSATRLVSLAEIDPDDEILVDEPSEGGDDETGDEVEDENFFPSGRSNHMLQSNIPTER